MSDDALGAQTIQQQRSTKDAAAEKAAKRSRRETQNQREIHWVIRCEGKRVSRMDTMSRMKTLCSEVWSQGETCEDIHGEADEGI